MGAPKYKKEDLSTLDLDSLKLQEQDLTSGKYPEDEIVVLKIKDEVIGHFWQQDLREFIKQRPSFTSEAEIQKSGDEEFTPIFDHPLFQRRRPQIVKAQMPAIPKGPGYYMLEHGQKRGPYSLEELKELVDTKKAILTDMISADDGQNWIKLYDLPEFDRRNESKSHLPHSPEGEVFSQSEQVIKESSINGDATEFIARLAYDGKENELIQEAPLEEDQDKVPTNKSRVKILKITLSFTIAIGAIFFIMSQDSQKLQKAFKEQINRNKKGPRKVSRKKRKTHIKRTPAARNTPRPTKRAQKRAPTSRPNNDPQRQERRRRDRFVEMKNKRSNDRDQVYDDGTDPVELDPIRRTLSKDNIDPQDDEPIDNYNYDEGDIDDPADDPAPLDPVEEEEEAFDGDANY